MLVSNITLAATIFAIAALPALPQESKKQPGAEATKPDADTHEMQNPKTPEHAHLALFAGDWDFKLTVTMAPESMTITGTESSKLIYDGLYLVSVVSAGMGEQIFEGRGITGYDRHAKEFIGVWVDVEHNKASFSRGTFDSKAKTLTMRGDMATPDGIVKTRTIATVKDENNRHDIVYSIGKDGDEKVIMDFVYARRKEPASLKPAAVDMKASPDEITKLAGKWSAEFVVQDSGPGDAKIEAMGKGTETSQLVCGGKWLWTDLDADFPNMKFNAIEILGFDPESKKYTAVWCDNQSGCFDVAEGDFTGKTRSMEGTTYDAAGKRIKWWETSTCKDADNRTINWKVAGSDAQPAWTMNVTLTRKK